MEITLKTLVVTFDDDTTQEKINEVYDLILDLADTTGAVFTVEPGTEVIEVEESPGD